MPAAEQVPTPARAGRFAAATRAGAARLPFGLSRVVAPRLLGFAAINAVTFGLDLALLTVLHGRFGWSVPAAVTASYATALAVGYVLNRVLNFESRAPAGPQLARYGVVVGVNYVGCVMGIGAGLAAAGLDYRLARVLAGLCEAVFGYAALRLVVFRER